MWNFITLAAFVAVYLFETIREKWLIDNLDCDGSKPDDVSQSKAREKQPAARLLPQLPRHTSPSAR